jgi:D-amino peptidase
MMRNAGPWAGRTLTASLCLVAGTAAAQERGFKVYISADMEGITGVVSGQQTRPGQGEYERFREIMTAEVNAAVEGARAAGATEVVVSDSHGSGQNILVKDLHREARLVCGFPRTLDMMHGIDGSFRAAVLIGYHAAAWRPGVLAHTGTGDVVDLRLNGVSVGEAGLSAAIAGHFGVGVAVISGDQVAIEELQALVPGVLGAQVKTAHGRTSATSVHPEKAQELIRERVSTALGRPSSLTPYRVKAPVTVDLAFKNTSAAEAAALLPAVERTATNAVRVVLPDMPAVARFFWAATSIDVPQD